jgi:membrane protease YdiL (CAAX protease family)
MAGSAASADPAVEQMVGFIGAGIYEETLFRLLLYSALMWLFHWLDFPAIMSFLLAAAASALLFSAAHHLGPNGEQFESYAFIFRTLAGVYFAVLFQMRGFGIAVGTHAGYDLLVGVVAS